MKKISLGQLRLWWHKIEPNVTHKSGIDTLEPFVNAHIPCGHAQQ